MRTQTQSIHLNVVNPGMLQSTATSGYPRVSGALWRCVEAAWVVTIVCGWWRVQAVRPTNTRNIVAAAEAIAQPTSNQSNQPSPCQIEVAIISQYLFRERGYLCLCLLLAFTIKSLL